MIDQGAEETGQEAASSPAPPSAGEPETELSHEEQTDTGETLVRQAQSGPALPGDASGEKLAALEAVLFMAAEPIGAAELAEILGVTPANVDGLCGELAALFEGRGVQVARVAGGYQVATRPEYGPFVAKLHKPERFRLSRAALETLAIVAYKQPVTRPEVEAVRGVNSDSAIDTLVQYQLVCEAGRKEAPGRPVLYRTTESFLGHFGLNSVADLPRIDSIPADEEAVRAEVERSLGAGAEPQATGEEGEDQPVAEPADAPDAVGEEVQGTQEQSG